MNNFFKTFFAALLAFVAANILLGMITIFILSGFVSSFQQKTTAAVTPGTVLKIDFAENITDSPTLPTLDIASLSSGSFGIVRNLSMLSVINAIKAAEADPNIDVIYINYTGPGNVSGTAQMEELRAALAEFSASGKFVVSYNDSYSQGLYWLCSVSDMVLMNPEGSFDWRGLASQVMFYKGLIDRLGVDVQVVRHGTYKAAVEPFITDKMSPANRQQMEALVGSMWKTIVEDVAEWRDIPVESLAAYADNLAIDSPAKARSLGMVDSLMYADQVMSYLGSLVGLAESQTDELNIVTLGEYADLNKFSGKTISRNKVAIVYADGEIVDGESTYSAIGGKTIAERLAEARKDKNVKAVVFRVNSPGGSALASEVMWREVSLLKAEKPVVVSMSNYAASGGYYISSPADSIIADRTTLTGSIGVFGLIVSARDALKNKAGITVDVAKTSPYADMGSMFRPLTKTETDYMQKSVEDVYSTFVNHVAEGRRMTFDEVDAIGQGRVWSGVEANGIGLVDSFGGLDVAIQTAARLGGVEDNYRVIEILEEENEFSALFNQLLSAKARSRVAVKDELGEALKYYDSVHNMIRRNGVQARMPYDITIY